MSKRPPSSSGPPSKHVRSQYLNLRHRSSSDRASQMKLVQRFTFVQMLQEYSDTGDLISRRRGPFHSDV